MLIEHRDLTRDEYLNEMHALYGNKARNWRLKCPVCGKEYTLGECGDTIEKAESGLWGCIGRINGKGGAAFDKPGPNEHGCNFAANGLFRSPWIFYEQKIGEGVAAGIMPIAPLPPHTQGDKP